MPENKNHLVPGHTSSPKSSSKKKQKKKFKPADCCPVCEIVIVGKDKEQGVTRDTTLFCKGQYNTWIHRMFRFK